MLQGQSDTVFVPLSGLVSVNMTGYAIWNSNSDIVFVPLSGLVSVNEAMNLLADLQARFSSPYRG